MSILEKFYRKKFVIVSSNDYANYGHSVAKSLRSVGVECDDFVLMKHRFSYSTQSTHIHKSRINPKKYDYAFVMHSCPEVKKILDRVPKKAVFHTGTRYREDPKYFNDLFRGYQSFTDQTEFLEFGNHHYIPCPVSIEMTPTIKKKPVKIGHYPSRKEVKGTKQILEMLTPFKFELLHSYKPAIHSAQLHRMSKCDIYIELFKPELNGKPYGCFGVTAMEAASMGKIVVTNNLHLDVYEKAYRVNPFFIANTPEEFHETIEYLLSLSVIELAALQKFTKNICDMNHSFEATGKRILSLLK